MNSTMFTHVQEVGSAPMQVWQCASVRILEIPPVRLILHPFSNFFELISPSLSVNSPALILSKNSGVFLAKIG